MIEKKPTTDKRTAHYNLSQDLEKLYVAFIDNGVIKKRIQDIKRGTNTPNGRTVINDFWEKHSGTLKGLLLENKVSHSLILGSMIKTAASTADSTK